MGLALLSGSLSKEPGAHPTVSSADTAKYLPLNQILKSSLIHMLWWYKEFQLPVPPGEDTWSISPMEATAYLEKSDGL